LQLAVLLLTQLTEFFKIQLRLLGQEQAAATLDSTTTWPGHLVGGRPGCPSIEPDTISAEKNREAGRQRGSQDRKEYPDPGA
jgi:hypothetical protein